MAVSDPVTRAAPAEAGDCAHCPHWPEGKPCCFCKQTKSGEAAEKPMLVRQVAVAMFAPLETEGFHPSASQEDEARRVIKLVGADLRERLLSNEVVTRIVSAGSGPHPSLLRETESVRAALEAALDSIGLNKEAV